jgi:hypothetical protein
MPTISRFMGITITMYWDEGHHGRPHFHARFGEYRASLDLTGEVIGDHKLRLTFEDGLVGDVDFTGRNWRRVFEPLADQAFFARVRVDPEIGTVVWPNGVDMAPETLYERACEHQVRASSRIPA